MTIVNKTNEENFDKDVFLSTEPVLVDFYSDWCGPCKALGPVLDDLAKEKGIKIFKVDCDHNPNLIAKYGVRSIPTVILFKNGIAIKTFVGNKSKTEIVDWMTN